MGIIPSRERQQGSNGISRTDNIIYLGKVVSINEDPFDDFRIKVRLIGPDDKISNKDLVFCDPLLPKFLSIIPQVGEYVKIFLFNTKNQQQNRNWVGNIISQPQKLKKDTDTALSTMNRSILSPEENHKIREESRGIYPDQKDIAIQGRDNTDINQREREVVIRAGKFEFGNPLKLNKTNPGYFHVRMSDDGSITTANIVADKINLITHQGSPTFRGLVKDKSPDDVIDMFSGKLNDKVQEQINENTHSIVYGDKLVELLSLIIEFLNSHSHPNPGMGPDLNARGGVNSNLEKILKFDLSEGNFRSKNIKIN